MPAPRPENYLTWTVECLALYRRYVGWCRAERAEIARRADFWEALKARAPSAQIVHVRPEREFINIRYRAAEGGAG